MEPSLADSIVVFVEQQEAIEVEQDTLERELDNFDIEEEQQTIEREPDNDDIEEEQETLEIEPDNF